jgi:hypothetical protein
MRRMVTILAFAVAVIFIFGAASPAFAFSAAQVTGVTFQYPQYLNGVYIFKGSQVTVGFTVTNVGSQYSTFLACTWQSVAFHSGGYGDKYLLGCATISLAAACLTNITYCVSQSGTLVITGPAYASAPGQLLIRVLVYDTTVSSFAPITTSQWYPVTYIIPQTQPTY